ncbi:hypothetical protein EBQ91_00035 [bacterium]|nr:hypothetical protein [bacterium]
MENQFINFLSYRQKNKIAADALRSICKNLKIPIQRDGAEHLIPIWNDYFNIETETLLNHALIEYRRTGDIISTSEGKFIYFNEEEGIFTTDRNINQELITEFINPTDITPIQGTEKIPKKQKKNLLLPVESVNKIAKAGADIITNDKTGYEILLNIVQALQEIPTKMNNTTNTNVLSIQQNLLEASEKGFLLNHEQVSILTGFSKSTISSKKTGWIRYGFTFTKVKEGSTTLWRVSKP